MLGICVGMQVLFSAGVEHEIRTEGCEVWPGTVQRLDAPVLPHMGWNTVVPPDGSVLFAGLDAGTRFYFVHSYALRMRDGGPLLALDLPTSRPRVTVATHGEPFAAAVKDAARVRDPVPPGEVRRRRCRGPLQLARRSVTRLVSMKFFQSLPPQEMP